LEGSVAGVMAVGHRALHVNREARHLLSLTTS